MTTRSLLGTALLLTALAACDKKEDAAPAAKAAAPAAKGDAKGGAKIEGKIEAKTETKAAADKPAPAAAQGVKIVANFEEFNGTYDKSIALINNIGVEIHLARDCPALTCEVFTVDGSSRDTDLLLKACPKVFIAEVGIEGAKDLPVGEYKAEIGLLGVAESSTNAMARESDPATVKITERTPQAFVGSIDFGTAEEGDSSAKGTFSATICPHKD